MSKKINDRRRSIYDDAVIKIKKGDLGELKRILNEGLSDKSDTQREREIERQGGVREPTSVDVASQTDSDGETFLHKVARVRDPDLIDPMVEAILDAAAGALDGNAINKNGDTALDIAAHTSPKHAKVMKKALNDWNKKRSVSRAADDAAGIYKSSAGGSSNPPNGKETL